MSATGLKGAGKDLGLLIDLKFTFVCATAAATGTRLGSLACLWVSLSVMASAVAFAVRFGRP